MASPPFERSWALRSGSVLVKREQQLDQRFLAIEIDARRCRERIGVEALLPLRPSELVARLAEQDDVESGLGET